MNIKTHTPKKTIMKKNLIQNPNTKKNTQKRNIIRRSMNKKSTQSTPMITLIMITLNMTMVPWTRVLSLIRKIATI